MFGSEIIDVAVGIVFLFLMLSLICSAVSELIEGILKKRASDLERGIRELLTDPTGAGFVTDLYQHPLVNGLFRGTYDPNAANKTNLPTYIPARTFAIALMDIVLPADAARQSGAAGAALPPPAPKSPPPVVPLPTTAQLRTALTRLAPSPTRTALLSLVDAAGTDPAVARQNIEDWYNSSMDRVSGWFKRRTQFMLFVIGIVLVVFANADTIGFARYLSTDKAARTLIVQQAALAVASPSPIASQQAQTKTKTQTQTQTQKPPTTPSSSGSPATAGIVPPAPAELVNSLGWLEKHGGIPFGWVPKPAPPEAPADSLKAADPALYAKQLAEYKTYDEYNKQLTEYGADWRKVPDGALEWLVKVTGLLLTACAITLGAPFWFDVLNKFMVVRSTIKPKEKSLDEASKS